MTYRLEFHAIASARIPGLPGDAYTALVETLVAILRDPYTTTRPEDLDEAGFRWAVFGERGFVSVYVNDETRTIHVHAITWAG